MTRRIAGRVAAWLCLALAVLVPLPAAAQSCDRDCLADMVTRYVDALLKHDPAGLPLAEKVNALLRAPEGQRDWPLRFYSHERLFSKEARLGWVEPDISV